MDIREDTVAVMAVMEEVSSCQWMQYLIELNRIFELVWRKFKNTQVLILILFNTGGYGGYGGGGYGKFPKN